MIFSTEVTPIVLIFRNPTAELFGMLVEIFTYGFDGLSVGVIFLILYLFLNLISRIEKSTDEKEANQETDIHQADTTTQGETTNGSDQSHDPMVEEALESVRADMEAKETERCADCGDISQPDSEYCSHCARYH